MEKYKFLLKPTFFIFNLLFSTWLVFQIEKISPSDFGKYKSIFENPPKPVPVQKKQELKKLCSDYKAGLLDSAGLEQQLDKFLVSSKEVSVK